MDVVEEGVRRVLAVIAEKNPDLPEEQRQVVATQVGLGALVYSALSVDNNKDTVFELDAALSFDGRTAPYLQNAHVRANSILKKAGDRAPGEAGVPPDGDFDYDLSSHEGQLIELLAPFPPTVHQ